MTISIAPDARPRLSCGVRLHEDRVRGRTVLLAPEHVVAPNASAIEILRRCNGALTFSEIVDDLAQTHGVPRDRVAADAERLIKDLIKRRMVDL